MHEHLSEGVKRWISSEQWSGLNAIQNHALDVIMSLDRDAVIAAPTAGGKTEAAFLAIFSLLEAHPHSLCIYISPLKALINDQAQRLKAIGDQSGINVQAWHGDIDPKSKNEFRKNPRGVLLITPESLETFLQDNEQAAIFFRDLLFAVIDEAHSFQEDPRGRQVQSLLSRIEHALQRRTIRIGLSATIGCMTAAREFVRPEAPENVSIIQEESGTAPRIDVETAKSARVNVSEALLIFAEYLMGKKAIIFANSRNLVERVAFELDQIAGFMGKIGAHHGMLPKEARELVEKKLKQVQGGYTAVCTSTFEMGLDVGSVEIVGQIGTPNTVASIKQRAGRSGRQRDPSHLLAVLFAEHKELSSGWLEELNLQWLEDIAKISLFAKGRLEAPYTQEYHGSTLLHQLLAFLRQVGEVDAIEVYSALLVRGGFSAVTKDCFVEFLVALDQIGLVRLKGVHLTLGPRGRQLVQEPGFATAFRTTPAASFHASDREVGRLPIDVPVLKDDVILLSGQRWRVTDVTPGRYEVVPDDSTTPAISIAGRGETIVNDIVREEMRHLLMGVEHGLDLCSHGTKVLQTSREAFNSLRLDKRRVILSFDKVFVFCWRGDRYLYGVKVLLEALDKKVFLGQGYARFDDQDLEALLEQLNELQRGGSASTMIAQFLGNPHPHKYDQILPKPFLEKDVVSRYFVGPAKLKT